MTPLLAIIALDDRDAPLLGGVENPAADGSSCSRASNSSVANRIVLIIILASRYYCQIELLMGGVEMN
jgi:hypothetical protein